MAKSKFWVNCPRNKICHQFEAQFNFVLNKVVRSGITLSSTVAGAIRVQKICVCTGRLATPPLFTRISWHPINISHCGGCQTHGWLIVALLLRPPRLEISPAMTARTRKWIMHVSISQSCEHKYGEIKRRMGRGGRWAEKGRKMFHGRSWRAAVLGHKTPSHNETISHKSAIK